MLNCTICPPLTRERLQLDVRVQWLWKNPALTKRLEQVGPTPKGSDPLSRQPVMQGDLDPPESPEAVSSGGHEEAESPATRHQASGLDRPSGLRDSVPGRSTQSIVRLLSCGGSNPRWLPSQAGSYIQPLHGNAQPISDCGQTCGPTVKNFVLCLFLLSSQVLLAQTV